LNAAIKTLYPNLTDKERASAVRQLQGKRLPGRFARWTASEAKDSFVDWADTSGISYDEDFLHTVKNDNYIDWQLIARCFAAKDEAPRETFLQRIRNVWTSTEGAPENIVIMFWSDVAGILSPKRQPPSKPHNVVTRWQTGQSLPLFIRRV
jgi:hypothetical protein